MKHALPHRKKKQKQKNKYKCKDTEMSRSFQCLLWLQEHPSCVSDVNRVSTTSLVRAEHECMYTLTVVDNQHKAMEIMLNPYAGIIVATSF